MRPGEARVKRTPRMSSNGRDLRRLTSSSCDSCPGLPRTDAMWFASAKSTARIVRVTVALREKRARRVVGSRRVPRLARWHPLRHPSAHRSVLDVRDPGRLDGPDLFDLDRRGPEVFEKARTTAEHNRDHVQFQFVKQPCRQVLLDDLGATPEHD